MKKINLIEWLSRNSHEKQKPQRFARYAAILIMLLTLGVGQMWAGHDFFDKGACGVKVNYSGSTVTEIKKDKSGASTEALGTISKLYLKEWWFAAWENTDDFTGSESGTMYYRIYPSGSASGNYTSSSKNYYNWGGWSGGSQNVWLGNNSLNVDLYSGKNPGNYIMEYYFMMGSSYLSNGSNNYKISFTVPGFSTTSKSHTFANTTVSGTKDETISFTQHYGTALTTSNCALTGTNKSEFEVRSISETGVTVRFKPSTAGSKSATLTITDAHSKTCTITLSGTTQYTVTYNKGDNGTGSNVTANKVYGTNLTLRSSGDFSRTGYNHTAWNTNSAGTGGTSYSLGGTYSTEAAVTLYPTWTPKTTTVTLNKNTPDGQTVSGDASVTATYDSALPDFTALTCTGGYSLTGYWSESSGGTRIINADGTFAANSGIWNRVDGATLNVYAQWSADPGVSLSAAKTSSINLGETIRLTATGRNAANITRYEFYLGEDLAYTATTSSTTATYDYVVNTTGNKSFTVKMYYNSGSNNVTSSAEVLTLNTPTISLTSSKTTGINVGETITLTATASNLSPSATNKITYKFYEGSTLKATETVNSLTQTYSYTPTTTGNKTMKVTIDILEMATKTSSNVSLTLNTPSVSLAVKAGSPSNFYLGEGSTTLKATPSNVGAGVTPSYVFTDQIAGGVTSASQTDKEWAYNPSVSGQAKARTMKVTMTVGGSTYTGTVAVTVYEKWNIYVKNNCSWPLGVYYYGYGNGESASWPGTACSVYRGSWYTVTLDNKYPSFILGNGYAESGKRQLKGDNTHASNIATYPAGTGYTFTYGGELDGDNNQWYSLTGASLPVAPTVTTNSISTYDVTTATLGGNITNDGGDNTTSYGYYYSTNSELSSSNLGVGTRVEVGTGTKTGSYSKSQTGLSAGTTYYVLAYATNGFGTGYGTVRSFTTKVTVNFGTRTGGNAPTVTANAATISSGASVAKGATVVFTANKQDGYTFNAWYNHATAGSSVSTDNPYTIASIASNTTLYSTFTENKTSITITTDGHGTITTPSPVSNPYSLGVATTQPINASPNTGYHWNTWTVSGNAALASTATTQSNTAKGNGTAGGSGTVTATFTPNTYTIHFNGNGATSGTMSNQTGIAYDSETTITTNAFVKTGYNFAGWATSAGGEVVRADGAAHGNLSSTQGATVELYAKWTAKQCTVNFDFDESDTGYGSKTEATTSTTATYAAAMTSVTPPTAAEGYAFMGFYDAAMVRVRNTMTEQVPA